MYTGDSESYNIVVRKWVRVLHFGRFGRERQCRNITLYVGTRTTVCNRHWNCIDRGEMQPRAKFFFINKMDVYMAGNVPRVREWCENLSSDHNWFQEDGVGLSFILGFCQCD